MIQIAIRNFCVGGKEVPAVTSLQIAKSFGKEHFNVLRDIETILLQVPENFRKLNFEVSEYLSEQKKEMPMYVMSKDGFGELKIERSSY